MIVKAQRKKWFNPVTIEVKLETEAEYTALKNIAEDYGNQNVTHPDYIVVMLLIQQIVKEAE